MRLTELRTGSSSAPSFEVFGDEGRERLRAIYALEAERYVRLNMVTTLTGSAAGVDGTSDSLSSRVDRTILAVIREDADGVLVGAASVRAEGYVVPRGGRLAIVTSTGDLGAHRLADDADRVLLVCPAGRTDEVRDRAGLKDAAVVGVPGDRPSPAAVRDALADHGMRRIVCEGGPTLASAFATAGLIDEYCVTVAPVLSPREEPFVSITGTGVETSVVGHLVDEASFSYLRLRPRRPVPGGATSR